MLPCPIRTHDDVDTVEINWWRTYCCELDLEQITTTEERDITRIALHAHLNNEYACYKGAWPTRDAALAALATLGRV